MIEQKGSYFIILYLSTEKISKGYILAKLKKILQNTEIWKIQAIWWANLSSLYLHEKILEVSYTDR